MGSKSWTVGGNTYQVRDDLKRMGGQWSPADKTWTIPYGTMAEKSSRSQTLFRLSKSAGITYR